MPSDAHTAEGLVEACLSTLPGQGLAQLIGGLGETPAEVMPERVLTRSGWHRLGGVVDGGYRRVAESIAQWVEQESGGEVEQLVSRYAGAGYFATRLRGQTHYLVFPKGGAAADFVQLEVEELQEVLDRYLIDPDWLPESLEEFIDPLDYPRVQPEPIGEPRFLFRRMTDMKALLAEEPEAPSDRDRAKLRRFLADWEQSSAGTAAPFCRHWVVALRETPASDGGQLLSARPVPTAGALPTLAPYDGARGPKLANRIHRFDHEAGYPFAWYFHMLCGRLVPFELGEAVAADLAGDFAYLAPRDHQLLQEWRRRPYAF